jgi:hypothetical protein
MPAVKHWPGLRAAMVVAALGAFADTRPVGGQSAVRPPPASRLIGPIRRGPDGQIQLAPVPRALAPPRSHDDEPPAGPPDAAGVGPGWIADARTGCQVWNADPRPGESITWSGSCAGGRASGPGILQWFDNDRPVVRVEAEYRDGQSLGRGRFDWPDGAYYIGEYSHSGWQGHGTFVWAGGERYEGEWQEGEPSGHGIYVWADGSRYEGEWREGQREGRGLQVWANGARYEGTWREGVPHGSGSFTGLHGTYTGTWSNGCFRDGGRRAAIGLAAGLPSCP